MAEAILPMPFGRTRWRLAVLVLLPALLVVGSVLVLVAKGVIAVSFAIAGTNFTVTADSVTSTGTDANGVGFYQFGVLDFGGNGTPYAQAENVIPHAKLTNLCQAITVGPLTLRVTAGGGSTPVTATNLIIDATSLSAVSATFDNIKIGQDMSEYPNLTSPTGRGSGPNVVTARLPSGTLGQVATGVHLTGVQQLARATSATAFTLPNLSVHFGGSC